MAPESSRIQQVPPPRPNDAAEAADRAGDDAAIRYSLTALGEAFVTERAGKRFRGFGPCAVATLAGAG